MDEFITKFKNNEYSTIFGMFRFFGMELGQTYDGNIFELKCVNYEQNEKILRLEFDGGLLTIKNPVRIEVNRNSIEISKAKEIRWDWFLYGEPKTKENKRYWIFKPILNLIVSVKTNDEFLKSGYRKMRSTTAFRTIG